MAAEGTFTLRAVDATRQAFANIQNSFGRLNNTAVTISKTLKFAFGANVFGSALKAINNQLDNVIDKQDELGFSEKDVRAAMEMEAVIDGILKMLMQLPIALGKLGIEMANVVGVLDPSKIEERLTALRTTRQKKEIDDLGTSFAELQTELNSMGVSQGILASEARNRIVTLNKELEAIGSTKPVEQLKKMIEIQKLENSIKSTNIALTKELVDAKKEFDDNLPKATKDFMTVEETILNLSNRYANLTYQINGAKTALDAYEESGGPVEETQQRLVELYKEAAAVAGKLNPLLKEQGKIGRDAGEIIASGFEDAILAGEKFSEVLKQIGRDLVRLVFQNVITAPLAKGIGGAINTALGMRAMGGPVSANTPYLVGERGAELFVPHASGSIVSNSNMNQGGGSAGSSININYNIAAGVTRNELAPILEQERRRLKAEIPDMVRRGGAYRSAFA
jgi:hypothetical protein